MNPPHCLMLESARFCTVVHFKQGCLKTKTKQDDSVILKRLDSYPRSYPKQKRAKQALKRNCIVILGMNRISLINHSAGPFFFNQSTVLILREIWFHFLLPSPMVSRCFGCEVVRVIQLDRRPFKGL